MTSRPDAATVQEGRRLAVGVYTALAGRDGGAAWAMVADADPEHVRCAAVTLAGMMAGWVAALAEHEGRDEWTELRRSATVLGLLVQLAGESGG
jgi:hypothetical protein